MATQAVRLRRRKLTEGVTLSERIETMKSNATNMLRTLPGLTLWLSLLAGVAIAQTSITESNAKSSEACGKDSVTTETPEPVGNFDVISSLEFGYRGLEWSAI